MNRYGTLMVGVALMLGCSGEMGSEEESAEVLGSTRQGLVPAIDRVPLVTFFSPSRGDFFTTTQPAWTCKVLTPSSCAADPGYQAVGVQGYVFSPDRPQPAGTVPLYHWFSPSRGDNMLTTDPAWAGRVGDYTLLHDGYQLFRIEGYVPTTSSEAATVALDTYWNAAERDHATVVVKPGAPLAAGWSFLRRAGFLLSPKANGGSKCGRLGTNFKDSPPWTALGNFINTWSAPANLFDGDALQIAAEGQTRIDFWGTHKNVTGEGVASAGWPAPGEPMWSLIGRVTTGRMWVPGRGSYAANVWFPVGAGTGCLEYDAQGVIAGDLQLMINDTNIGDNAGGPSVTVSQWW